MNCHDHNCVLCLFHHNICFISTSALPRIRPAHTNIIVKDNRGGDRGTVGVTAGSCASCICIPVRNRGSAVAGICHIVTSEWKANVCGIFLFYVWCATAICGRIARPDPQIPSCCHCKQRTSERPRQGHCPRVRRSIFLLWAARFLAKLNSTNQTWSKEQSYLISFDSHFQNCISSHIEIFSEDSPESHSKDSPKRNQVKSAHHHVSWHPWGGGATSTKKWWMLVKIGRKSLVVTCCHCNYMMFVRFGNHSMGCHRNIGFCKQLGEIMQNHDGCWI